MQFLENILLLQCLKKETATAKEHDLGPLGKVIIFRDRQTDRTFLLYIDLAWLYLFLFRDKNGDRKARNCN